MTRIGSTNGQRRQHSPLCRRPSNRHDRSTSAPLVGLLLLLVLLSDHSTLATTTWRTPVSVGLRSALASRTSARTSRSSSRQRTSLVSRADPSPIRLVSDHDEFEDDEWLAQDAVIRTSPSDRGMNPLFSVTNAYETSSTRYGNEDMDELDFLEAQTVPCSVRRVATALPPSSLARTPSKPTTSTTTNRGGAASALRSLSFWENMVCGAISRSVAQTIMHPANTMKTILQNSRGPTSSMDLLKPSQFRRLTQGAGANFILSVPHGAVNFAVLEFVRLKLAALVDATPALREQADRIGPGLDFLSSALSTITCSIVSTPQMMLTDNIMAGNYPNLPTAMKGLAQSQGVKGFYSGWWPGLAGKIPSYALTWMFFQQLKLARDKWSSRPATNVENSIMGCIASGTTVCIMIPMDTIKTRLVTQAASGSTQAAYKGIVDCAVRVMREEGIGTFYRGLSPRLVSVVPMIGIQFGVYEAMKRFMLQRQVAAPIAVKAGEEYGSLQVLEEAAMEVAASPENPFPAPHFLQRARNGIKKNFKSKKLKKKKKRDTVRSTR